MLLVHDGNISRAAKKDRRACRRDLRERRTLGPLDILKLALTMFGGRMSAGQHLVEDDAERRAQVGKVWKLSALRFPHGLTDGVAARPGRPPPQRRRTAIRRPP